MAHQPGIQELKDAYKLLERLIFAPQIHRKVAQAVTRKKEPQREGRPVEHLPNKRDIEAVLDWRFFAYIESVFSRRHNAHLKHREGATRRHL